MSTYDYFWYTTVKKTFHIHDLKKELLDLDQFINKNKIKVSTVIDIGCGDGKVTEKVMGMLGVKSIDGLDINEELLKKAKEKGINTILADFNNIGLNDRYDLVMCYGTLHHSSDKKKTIENIAKLSNKYILIVDLTVRKTLFHTFTNNRFYRFDATSHEIWSREKIIKEIEKNGFKIIDFLTNKNANYFHDRSFILAERINK